MADEPIVTKKDLQDLIEALQSPAPNKFTSMITSRRFQIFIATIATVIATKYGVNLDNDVVLGMLGLAATFIAGDSYRKMGT